MVFSKVNSERKFKTLRGFTVNAALRTLERFNTNAKTHALYECASQLRADTVLTSGDLLHLETCFKLATEILDDNRTLARGETIPRLHQELRKVIEEVTYYKER